MRLVFCVINFDSVYVFCRVVCVCWVFSIVLGWISRLCYFVGIGIGISWLAVFSIILFSSIGLRLLLWWLLLVIVLLVNVNGYSVLCVSGIVSSVLVVISVVMYDVVELFMFEFSVMFLLIFIVKLNGSVSVLCSVIRVVLVVLFLVCNGRLNGVLWMVVMCILGVLICCIVMVLFMLVMVWLRMLKLMVVLLIDVGENVWVWFVFVFIGVFFYWWLCVVDW